ncbi:hypothetical protein GEV29_02865 [Aeromicrobium sp. SMF47]|uniref:hypothetical protein n=1 Tax=Aeromicrobium yanjiei TaxID=2662028 RepID=UPI00129D956C|nr:hypothetical protein [Aeromicrobium yanjiei]MRJ75467.1 hypothetical protein [Aeromicrobium yanjiei]
MKSKAEFEKILARADEERARRFKAFQTVRDASRQLYFENGVPVLRGSTVTFLDLLGTSERLKNLSAKDLPNMLRFSERVQDWFGDVSERDSPNQILAFSDNIAIGTPFDDSWFDRGLLAHVFAVGGIQLNVVAGDGTLLRGGMAQGPLHMNENVVVGAGLVAAYELERDEHLPRVVVADSTLVGALAESLKHVEPNSSPTNAVLLVDPTDDAVFVNYLETLLDGSPVREVRQALQSHRVVIRAGLTTNEPGRIREKYEWTAEFHNWFCARVGQSRYRVHDPLGRIAERDFKGLVEHWDASDPTWRSAMREFLTAG